MQTRDVRYINTVTRSGKARVFRNKDTGWGWPPYFKFDSADQTARVQTIMQNPENSGCGFDTTDYAVSIKVLGKDYTHIPVFNIMFLTILIIGVILIVRDGRGRPPLRTVGATNVLKLAYSTVRSIRHKTIATVLV